MLSDPLGYDGFTLNPSPTTMSGIKVTLHFHHLLYKLSYKRSAPDTSRLQRSFMHSVWKE